MSRSAWTALNAVMLLAFLFSAAVQYNDPDPVRWMAIYGAAAAICAAELRRRTRLGYPALVGAIALAWAASIAPRVLGVVRFSAMFAEFEMKNAGVEESREMYGLLIVAAWMAAVAVAARLRSARRTT
jgi:transmembrane protein TMEM220